MIDTNTAEVQPPQQEALEKVPGIQAPIPTSPWRVIGKREIGVA